MTSSAESFERALEHHKVGNLALAERLYRQLLQVEPRYADAHHMLGVLACQVGRFDLAVPSIQQALKLDPLSGVYFANLGVALESLGRLEHAAASYLEALRLRPDDANSHYNLGNVYRRQRRLADAMNCYRQAIRLKPDYGQAHCNLGMVLVEHGDLDEAIDSYRLALQHDPHSAETHNNLGSCLMEQDRWNDAEASFREALRCDPRFPQAHYNLGCALLRQDRLDDALAYLRESVRLLPHVAETHNSVGYALEKQGKFAEAALAYEQAMRLNPNFADAFNNFGNALERLDKVDDAVRCYHKALALNPDKVETLNDMASVVMHQGEFDTAMAAYDKAIRLNPDFSLARHNRTMLRLLLGDFENGWTDYEYRWDQPDLTRRQFKEPRWDGTDLHGKSILLYAEQGLGDTLQMVRYAQIVQNLGARVIFEFQPPLVQLLSGVSGIDQLVPQNSPLPPFDVQIPLFSLLPMFRTTLESIYAEIPYLRADPKLVEKWRLVRGKGSGGRVEQNQDNRELLVGIAWQGRKEYRYDRERSIPLKYFARLAEIPGVKLVSLQKKGPGLIVQGSEIGAVDLGDDIDSAAGAFMDTAAIIKNLDLVICSDSAIAHLAGGLGATVWLALTFVPDWRWLLERQDSPWYPTMRLFRQRRTGDWEEVFTRIAEELRRKVSETT